MLFGYLKEFGESDATPGEPEKRVINLFGSLAEQQMVLSRLGMMSKLFETLRTNRKYMEAYEVGVSFGLTADSIRLLSENLLFKSLNREQEAQLETVCGFLQAEYIATNPWPRTRGGGGIHKVLRAATGRGSSQINSFVKVWEDINRAFDTSTRHRTRIERGKISGMQIASYVDILVCYYEIFKWCSPLTHV